MSFKKVGLNDHTEIRNIRCNEVAVLNMYQRYLERERETLRERERERERERDPESKPNLGNKALTGPEVIQYHLEGDPATDNFK